ncbi:hypothetical protein L1049_010054 [Liquidambar formosana]|uniref:Pollen Ole e 1 allergen and extensin family protein n=1 Tax=Liquidambar formosana TaxID=63359 RepID=A0AAP0N7T0_LIQFO
MSDFGGCHNLVMFLFILFFFLGTSKAGRENPLVMSSREYMVEMAGYGEEKLSTVLVTGTVLCEACLDGQAQLQPWPVLTVVVACQTSEKKGKSSWAQGVTDEYGDFIIDLPSHLHGIPNLDKTCLVKVLRLPKNSLCQPTFRIHKGIRLSSVGNGIRTYTAGTVRFLHSTPKPSQACMKKGITDEEMSW